MKDVVHIIGHKNPDTDSIVSAIAYAQPVSYTHLTLPTIYSV